MHEWCQNIWARVKAFRLSRADLGASFDRDHGLSSQLVAASRHLLPVFISLSNFTLAWASCTHSIAFHFMYQASQVRPFDPSPRSSNRPSQAYSSHSQSPSYTSTPATSSVSSGALGGRGGRPPVKPIDFPEPAHYPNGPQQHYGVDRRSGYRPYDDLGNDADYEYVEEDTDPIALTGMDPYLGVRPIMQRRESQDVEFSHRSPAAGRLRPSSGWEVNIKMPKGLSASTAKAKALLHHRLPNLRGLRRSHTVSGAPPLVFRDSQPVPASVRQQYSELAPAEGVVHQSSDGRLAVPGTTSTSSSTTPPVSLLDVELRNRDRRSRTQSVSQRSPSMPPAPSLHRRARSADSRRSSRSQDLDDTVVGHSTQMTHGDTTVVNHDNMAAPSTSGSWYAYLPRLPSSKSGSSTLSSFGTVKASSTKPSHYALPPPSSVAGKSSINSQQIHGRPHVRTSSHPLQSMLDPVVKIVHHLQRLPWVAEAPAPRGWIVPNNDPPRIAADFIPHKSSARSRYRVITNGDESGSRAVRDLHANMDDPSWYRPRVPSSKKELQNLWRAGVSANAAVANAYQNYLESAKRMGRPRGYMYGPQTPHAFGPQSGRSASSYEPAMTPMPYAPSHARSVSMDAVSAAPSRTGSNYVNAPVYRQPPQAYDYAHGPYSQPMPQAVPGPYLERRVSQAASQEHRSNYSSSAYSSPPPPVPSKEGLPARNYWQQPQAAASYAQSYQQQQMPRPQMPPPQAVYIAPSVGSIPSYVSSSHTSNNITGSGGGYGSVVGGGFTSRAAPQVPVKYVPYTYSYA